MSAAKSVGSQTTSQATLTASSLFPFWASTMHDVHQQLPVVGGRVRAGAAAAAADRVWHGDCRGRSGRDVAEWRTPTVAEPAIDVAVKYNGSYVAPGQVWVTFTGSGTGGACSDKWQNIPVAGTELVSGVTKYVYPAPFASTAAVGASNASATGDPGNITVACSTRPGPQRRHESTTTAMTNTNFTAPTSLPAMDLKNDTTGTGHTASASGPCT